MRDDWEKWLSYHYLVFNNDATSNQVKGFISVLKGFVTKVDETYGTNHLPIVVKMTKGFGAIYFRCGKGG